MNNHITSGSEVKQYSLTKIAQNCIDREIVAITVDADGKKTVNARELHAFLEAGSEFRHWIKDRIEQYGFSENIDFITSEKIIRGGKAIDYHITLDMAKELAMVERNEKGKQARQYFIECERKASINPVDLLNDPTAMRGMLLNYTEKVIQLENHVKELVPKADALDRFATFTDGSFCLRDAAKTLQIQEKRFVQALHERHWIYRRPMGTGWLAYSDKLQSGLMEHKVTTGHKGDGSEWASTQPRITAKGLAKLSEIFSIEGVAA